MTVTTLVSVNTLVSFDGTDGKNPVGELVMDGAGDLFGVTAASGSGYGTVFEVPSANGQPSTSGQVTTLHTFTASHDGSGPFGSLSMTASGDLYGTTYYGGSNAAGTVFALSLFRGTYTYTKVADLGGSTGTPGYYPAAGVYVAPDGTIYGTTSQGGTNGAGTVFTIPPTGSTPTYTSLPAAAPNPNQPYLGPYTVSPPTKVGANVYTTSYGDGTETNPGAIFSFNTQTSTLSTVATFNKDTGYESVSGLIADSAGNLYGTTELGGGNKGDGTIFQFDPSTGHITTLASFDATKTGDEASGNLLLDGAGDLFGTTYSGGGKGYGTVFELKAGSTIIQDLHDFSDTGTDGANPYGGLVADQAGDLFGTTYNGGTDGDGTVYEIQNAGFVPVCYASGTRIRTTEGDIVVEALAVGDRVVTSTGEQRPIKWLGHRLMECRRHADPLAVMPVRIAAHALGPNRPARDLHVSPGHSICLDVVGEVLIPAAALVNGATIAQVEVDEMTYWHVELDSHDILLAENLPAESYLDMDNRTFFTESDVVALDVVPDVNADLRTHADFCRPYHDGGPLIDCVRARTRSRALALGWSLSTALDVHLEVDGRRVDPVVRDRTIRFLVPAEAKDVWLVSPTARPCDAIIGSSDGRTLGLDLTALHIDDGFGSSRDIAVDDPLLDTGFSRVENGSHRWTTGRARLPAELWNGCTDAFFLRLDLGGEPVARWIAPAANADRHREAV